MRVVEFPASLEAFEEAVRKDEREKIAVAVGWAIIRTQDDGKNDMVEAIRKAVDGA